MQKMFHLHRECWHIKGLRGVLVLLNFVPILVCLDGFSHMEALTHTRCKSAQINRIEHSPGARLLPTLFFLLWDLQENLDEM